MKLYVPNPQVWVDFFDRVSTGKASLNQSGAGRRPRVITVNQSKPTDDDEVNIKAVLPAEQTTARAKSELEREDINPKTVETMFQKASGGQQRGIKRKSRSRTSSRSAKRQRGGGKRRKIQPRKRKLSKKRRYAVPKGQGDIFEIK
jgi:hypothetical protein